jgi:hypothetical protein
MKTFAGEGAARFTAAGEQPRQAKPMNRKLLVSSAFVVRCSGAITGLSAIHP